MQISKALHYLLSPRNLVSERPNEVLNQDKGEAAGGGGGCGVGWGGGG